MSTRGRSGDRFGEDVLVLIESLCRSAAAVDGTGFAGVAVPGRAGCNTNSPFPPSAASTTVSGCSLMLLCLDPSAAAADLAAGALACPRWGCEGRLGPWGHARPRWVRIAPSRRESHRPRRARCRSCGRTQVLVWARSHPRRVDAVETVGAALLASVSGLSDRAVAEQLGLPATTVRDWLRRARVNANAVQAEATAAVLALDANVTRIEPVGSALGDMLTTVGIAASAARRRFGPIAPTWQLATVITGAGILAARPPRKWSAR